MNKKLTKLLSVFALCGALGAGAAVGITGCTTKHEHTAKSEWSSSETQHWHDCTADDGEKLDLGNHVYDNDQDATCNDCGYTREITPSNPGGGNEDPGEDPGEGDTTVDLTPDTNGVVTISTAAEFVAFRQLAELPGTTYKLGADIDLEGVTLEAPAVVITEGKTFDGQGYTIKNAVYADAGAKTGILCAQITAGTVTNVKFLGCSVTSSNESAAILAGLCEGGTISKIEFNSCSVKTTSNYVGLVFARNTVTGKVINVEEITAKNGCTTSCAQYGGFVIGDMVGGATANFKNLDLDGEFAGSSGNGSFIAGRTRQGAKVSVENAVISAQVPVANSIGIFSGNGSCASLTIKNVLILKSNVANLYQSNKAPTDKIVNNLYAVEGVTVDEMQTTAGTATIAFLKDTLGFDFANVWQAEGENRDKYRLKAASTNVKSADAVISSIKVNAGNAKTRFKKGEAFEAAGLNVMGVYSDGVQLVLKETEGYIVDSTAFNTEVAGEYTITVKSAENNEKVQTYKVTVVEETGFEIIHNHMDHVYILGDSALDTANLVVKSVWSDGVKEKLAASEYTIDATSYDLNTIGVYNVSIAHGTYAAQTIKITVTSSEVQPVNGVVTIAVKENHSQANGAIVEGVATFDTVKNAINFLEAMKYDKEVIKVVNVGQGTYEDKITTDLWNLHLIGEGADKSVMTYSAVESTIDPVTGSQYGLKCATLQVNGEGFTAKNIAIRNDFDYPNLNKTESSPQGLALTINGDKAEIVDCLLYGNQDTLYLKNGRAYFKNTEIDGNIDFIFGEATGIAYFDTCTIKAINKAVAGKQEKNNGYVTAMKADASNKPDYGYVFNGCTFTDDGTLMDGSMSLGRPWGAKATVAYINCSFTKAYSTLAYDGSAKSRWFDMSGNKPQDADFCEYGSTGEGAITEAVNGGKILTAEQAANYTMANVFAQVNGKCTWSTPWAGTNDCVSVTVMKGSETVAVKLINKGIALSLDTASELFAIEEMNLTGLYTDAACTTAYDYATILSADLTLYATYEEADPTVKEYVKYTYDGTAPAKYGKLAFSGLVAHNDWLRFGDDNATIKFTAIKGTVINMTAYAGSTFTIEGNEVATVDGVATYTVAADGEVTISRKAGVDAYIKTVELVVPVSETTTIDLLQFTGQVQGGAQVWNGITIDATTGKFAKRTTDIQVNAGAKLSMLVAEGATIKVVAYNGNDDAANWTIDITNGVATLTAAANTYIKEIVVTVPEKAVAKNYTITVADGLGVVEGKDSNVTVAYVSKESLTTSPNKTDFKMDGNAAKVTLTIANAKAGQSIAVTVNGFTGSTGNPAGVKINGATNATASSTNPETVDFSVGSTASALEGGTFNFTVSADGTVTIKIARSISKTARIVNIAITVE